MSHDPEAEAEVPRIGPDDAKTSVGRPDAVILAVREPVKVAASGKVPEAIAIPRGHVEFRAAPPPLDAAFDRTKTIDAITYAVAEVIARYPAQSNG